jgi:hypothetical protein
VPIGFSWVLMLIMLSSQVSGRFGQLGFVAYGSP